MPTSLKVMQLPHQIKKDGTIPILIRVTTDRKSRYVKTGYYVKPTQFKDGADNWVTGHTDAKLINLALEAKRTALLERIVAAELSGNAADAGEIAGGKTSAKTFFAAARELLEMYEARNQVAAHTRLTTNLTYLKEAWGSDIKITELSRRHVEKYVSLRYSIGNSDSTVKKNLQDLSVILTRIGHEGKNPFAEYAKSIRPQPAQREKLTLDEIKLLETAELDGLVAVARDMFLFAFYCHGMRFESVALLENKNIGKGHIEYRMNKGKKIRQIELHPKLLALVDRYRNKGQYLFPVIKTTPTAWNKKSIVGTANTLMNTYLKRACIIAGITRHVHFHMARHTFATIGLQKGVGYEILKDALGHTNFATTQAYLKSLSDERINSGVRGIFE